MALFVGFEKAKYVLFILWNMVLFDFTFKIMIKEFKNIVLSQHKTAMYEGQSKK